MLKVLILCTALIMGCANRSPSYKLPSISTYEKTDTKQVMAFVNLKSTGSNTVSVYNWETYEVFAVYKSKDFGENFYSLGTLQAGKKPDISALVTQFEDDQNSSLDDRYMIYPIVGLDTLDALPISYATDSEEYQQKVNETRR